MDNEILASNEDVNGFLPDLLEVSGGNDRQLQIDANRVVKSQLAGVFTPLVLTGWDEPADTPQLIRGIAGRLIAAKYYAQQLSQETTNVPQFAQNLYNEAIAMLAMIKSGQLVVTDDDNNPISTGDGADLTSADVYPNNAAPAPIFSIGMEFG